MCRGQDAMDSGHRQRCRGRRNIPTRRRSGTRPCLHPP